MVTITVAALGCILLATLAPASAFVDPHHGSHHGSHSHSHSHSDSPLGKDPHGNDFCVDVSRYGHVAVNATWLEVEDTCNVEQICKWKNQTVCGDVTNMQCSIVAYTECKTTQVEEKCTKPVEEIKWADQWWCDERPNTTTHFKEMPVCKNVTKQNCVTKWEMDDQGNKYWAGNEDCEPVTWQECNITLVEKDFKIPKVDCHTENVPQIPYCDRKQVDSTRKRTTVKCEVQKTQSCKPTTVEKCVTIDVTDCRDEPVPGESHVAIWKPYQERLHLQKCLLPNL